MTTPAISEKTKVQLSLLVPIVAGLISAAIWVDHRFSRLEAAITTNWTLADQRLWVQESRTLGATLADPNEIYWRNRPDKSSPQFGAVKP